VPYRIVETGTWPGTYSLPDIIWFYLGYAGFFTLVDDNGWTFQKAEEWLRTAVSQALLKPAWRRER
jgi:hypothetical protein